MRASRRTLEGPGAGAAVADGPAPWSVEASEVVARVGTTPAGLDSGTAAARLRDEGPNELPAPPAEPWWRRVARQFADVLIGVLLASAALKAMLGDWVDFSVILAVAVVNAVVGLVQEGRAERALAAIRGMLSTRAAVLRDGEWAQVDAAGLVRGDVVRVRPGDRVPADLRLLDATNLRVEESALTGESVPAAKSAEPVAAEAALGDRAPMLFSGTLVAAGTGTGVVVETGGATEIGRIQAMVTAVDPLRTPLSRTLAAFGRAIAWGILVAAVVMVVVGRTVHGLGTSDLISAAIGFAVAAVPEGLPALVTITLALGVQQMARRRAITRRLPAVETLGAVTTICSDKTGTLTQNEMTAREVRTAAGRFAVTGTGYAPDGAVTLDGRPAPAREHADLRALAQVAAVCNDARLARADDGGWRLLGDPTEGALHVLGRKAGVTDDGWERVSEVPFDSRAKYMGVLARDPGGDLHVLVKGAPDRVLARCATQTGPDGTAQPVDPAFWSAQVAELGAQGLRVLAAARAVPAPGRDGLVDDDLASGLELVGIVGIVDPPRPEAVTAIATCHRAGVRVAMITGDHADTAVAIAREMGIVADQPRVLTGADLEAMSTERLRAVVRDVEVFARTSPEHKLRIVSALQARGEVVAMTGDGVNDAPALTQADVGVAMGIKGTEATKEAADIVLADDDFATIEAAVEEGRRIYANIRKSVLFLLPTNAAQSLVILVAVLAGITLPLEPVQVLWINMVTSITLSLTLAGERAEPGAMDRPPRDPRTPLLDGPMIRRVLLMALLIGGATMGVFQWEVSHGASVAQGQTTAVTTLALCQLAYLVSCRFLDRSSLRPGALRGNPALRWSALALVLFQAAFVYVPTLHTWFGSASIGVAEWARAAVLAVAVFLCGEAAKAVAEARALRRSRR